MKKFFLLTTFLGLLVIPALDAQAMHHEVKVAEKAEVGKYLADSEGKALYWFKKDSVDRSACQESCVNIWPVYYREKVAPPDNLKASDFGTITREDGASQTTFRGFPLYYFHGDVHPGDTKGNGLKNVWFLIDPDHFPH